MPLPFAKYHGLGNDFVLVDGAGGAPMPPSRAVAICDRHRGVGADGVVTLLPPRTPGAVARMHIYNPDGSVPEMCGNAIRCLAVHVAARRGLEGEIVFDTDAGPKACTLHRGPGGAVEEVSVEMGPAAFQGEATFTVGGEALRAARVSMGNPHAVIFEPAPASHDRVRALGPEVERAVPGGVNAGFAHLAPGGAIDLVVWERGAGLTQACGTGACAAAVAAVRRGAVRAGEPVTVRLPGGALRITVSADLARVTMRGPAVQVFQGETDI